jgi:hypothetical protein
VVAGFPHTSIAPHEILPTFRQAADVPQVIGREFALEDGPDEIFFRPVISIEEMERFVRVKDARDALNQLAEERGSRSPSRDDQNAFHWAKNFVLLICKLDFCLDQLIQKWRDFAFSHGLFDSNGSNTLGYPENERFLFFSLCRSIFFGEVNFRHKNQ